MDYEPDIEEIVKDDIHFCAHTILKLGILDNVWYKVGKSKNLGEPDKIMFRLFSEGDFSKMTKSYNWYVWQINKEHIRIGELTGKYEHQQIKNYGKTNSNKNRIISVYINNISSLKHKYT